ncbi:MAG: hypothetical protein WB586_01835 [Chthoniobacterales bacterium]
MELIQQLGKCFNFDRMSQPITQPRVYDCFLYNGEIDALEIRLHELAEVVHRFVVVESDTTFRGLRKTQSFDPSDPRVAPFAAAIRYVVVLDMPPTEEPWQRETWQRNAILRGLPDAGEDDIVLVSDVDEIPRAATVREMVQDKETRMFGLQLASYRSYVDYRNVAGPESAGTWTVAARWGEFERVAPHDLRHNVRKGHLPARVLAHAGWHFSGLMEGAWRKIADFSPEAFGKAGFLRTINIFGGARYIGRVVSPAAGRESRPYRNCALRWDIVDPKELPSWLQANREALPRLFCPRHTVARLTRSLVPHFTRSIPNRSAATPPVIICPYVHAHEAAEISVKFGLEEPRGRKLEFFLWHDADGAGPERAFQHCWDQFPERDMVILHSDMAPMPDDRSNRWYDALLQYRNKLPRAGMLACNLFYPQARPGEPWRVQCAGGTFREGQIGHLNGLVQKGASATAEGVPAEALRKVRIVDWVTFGGVLIRREVIRACGPVDDRYRWAYVMDVDYCFEARLRGFPLFQVPVALQHEAGRTTRALRETDSKLHEYVLRNFELFYDKWRPFSAALPPIG